MKVFEQYVSLVLNKTEVDNLLDFKYFLKHLRELMLKQEIDGTIAGVSIADIDDMLNKIDLLFDAAELEAD